MTVPLEERGPQLTGVVAFFFALSTLATILRCYCRAVVVKNFGMDDWLAVLAWMFFCFFCGFAIAGCYHGSGQHIWNLPQHEIPIGLKWWWSCEPVYVLSNMALKFSIGIFLLRIAVVKTQRIIIWITVAIIEIYGVIYFFIFVLQCRPSAYFWTQYTGGKGSCLSTNVVVDATYVYSAVSCVCDWALSIVPIFIVWNLQMNARTKISVAMILAVGVIASTATIVRIPYVKDLSNVSDFLYATTDVAIWSCSETGIGITASAFATLRPLFRTFLNRNKLLGGSSTGGATNHWPKSNPKGYVRSANGGLAEEFALRTDVGKHAGVTTIINSDADLERQDAKGGKSRQQNPNSLGRPNGWSTSESKLTETSSDEESVPWGLQIRKTTVSTQVAH